MGEAHFHRLHAAHRKARDGAAAGVRLHVVVGLDEGNDGGEHVLGKRGHLVGHVDGAVGHHDDHRDHLARGEQVVQDPACGAHAGPGGVVVAAAVDEIQHRQFRVGLLIPGRRPDVQAAHFAQGLGEVEPLRDRSVRNILDIAFAHGQKRGLLGGEGSLRVLHPHAVHVEIIAEHAVAQAFADALPDAVLGLFELDGGVPGQVAGDGHRLGFRSVDLEEHLAVREDAGGLERVVGGGTAAPLGGHRQGAAHGCEEDQETFHIRVFVRDKDRAFDRQSLSRPYNCFPDCSMWITPLPGAGRRPARRWPGCGSSRW